MPTVVLTHRRGAGRGCGANPARGRRAIEEEKIFTSIMLMIGCGKPAVSALSATAGR